MTNLHPRALAADWRVSYAALCVIWGFSFLLIKIGAAAFAPVQVSFGRMALGSAVLFVAVLVTRQRLPRAPRTLAHLAVSAFFLNALPFTLLAYAEQHISSTLTSICNATTPLWGMVIGLVALREDRPTPRRAGGLVLGFVGVLVVLGAWRGFAGQDLGGTALALVAAASYAVGWAYVRRFLKDAGHSHLAMSTTQILLGTVELAIALPLLSAVPSAVPLGPLAAVAVLGAAGTGLAALMQYRVAAEVGPTIAESVTFFIPVIATAVGVLLLDEGLGWQTPVGALIILTGAALLRSRRRPAEPDSAPVPTPEPVREAAVPA